MSDHTGISIDCFARGSTLVAPVDDTVATLREYERRGLVDDVTFTTWPDEVVLTGERGQDRLVARYHQFRAWADRVGVSLEPAFTLRERTTLLREGTTVSLVVPVLCVAVAVDGELRCVAPYRAGPRTYSVQDALADVAALADEHPTWPESPEGGPRATEVTTPDRCPVCADTLVSGQGVYACTGCDWQGGAPVSVAGRTRPATEAPDESTEDGPSHPPPAN